MSISSEIPRRVSLTAVASQTVFNFTSVLIMEADDLDVYRDGVLLNVGPDYSVALSGDPPSDGTVTLAVAAVGGEIIVIESQIQITQPTVYNPGTAFPSQSHEEALDRQAIISSDIAQRVRRLPLWDSVNNLDSELHLDWTRLSFPSLSESKVPIYDPVTKTVLWGDTSVVPGTVDFSALTGTLDISGGDPRIDDITVGTEARDLSEHLGDWVKTCDYGIVGDDVADDTAAFQAALDAAEDRILLVCKPAVAMRIGPVFIRDRTTLWFEPGVVIHVIAGLGMFDRVINVFDVSDVTIHGNMALLDMEGQFTTGEQRHGLFMTGSTRVRVLGFHVKGCGGDGFYVGNGTVQDWCEDVELRGCVSTENRRQGLSIVSADRCLVQGGVYQRTGKGPAGTTAPSAGIDIEANTSADRIRKIVISDVNTFDNLSSGILVVGSPFNNDVGPLEITISNHTSIQDLVGLNVQTILNDGAQTDGWVQYLNAQIRESSASSIIVRNWGSLGPKVLLEAPRIVNCNTSASASVKFGAAIGLIKEAADVGDATFGNITVNNAVLVDNRATGEMQTGIYVDDAANDAAQLIEINNLDVVWADATFDDSDKVRFTSSGIITDLGDKLRFGHTGSVTLNEGFYARHTNEGAVVGVTLTLGTSFRVGYPDLFFEVVEPFRLSVAVNAGDTLTPFGGDAGIIFSRDVGATLRLRRTGATEWTIIEQSGFWEFSPFGIETDSFSHTGDTLLTTAATYTLKANQMITSGQRLRFSAYGSAGGGGGLKTLQLDLGGTTLFSVGMATSSTSWMVDTVLDIQGSANQRHRSLILESTSDDQFVVVSSTTEDLTTAKALVFSFQLANAGDSLSVISNEVSFEKRQTN